MTEFTSLYAAPGAPALPSPGMQVDLSRTAFVVIDPQMRKHGV
jgi:hypothetical protein